MNTAAAVAPSGRDWGSILLLAPVIGFFLLMFVIPMAGVVWQSFGGSALSLDAYRELLGGRLFLPIVYNTVAVSLLCTVVAACVAYPISLHLLSVSGMRRSFCLLLVTLPLWTSIIVKSFAFSVLLGEVGVLNTLIAAAAGPGAAVAFLYNRTGVVIGMTHYLLPFMVFPLYSSLRTIDPSVIAAAKLMGAGPRHIFWRVILPLTRPGLVAGSVLCMLLSMGMFITPALLGGRQDFMLSNLVEYYIRTALDWNAASAIAVIMFAATVAILVAQSRMRANYRLF